MKEPSARNVHRMKGPRAKLRTSIIATMTEIARPSCAVTPTGCQRNANAIEPQRIQAAQRIQDAKAELRAAPPGAAEVTPGANVRTGSIERLIWLIACPVQKPARS